MAHTLRLKQTYRRSGSGVIAAIDETARAIAAEHALALRAAEKAASPRQSVAEVRAMYLPACEPQQDDDAMEATMKPIP